MGQEWKSYKSDHALIVAMVVRLHLRVIKRGTDQDFGMICGSENL